MFLPLIETEIFNKNQKYEKVSTVGKIKLEQALLRSANKGLQEHTYQFDSHVSRNPRLKNGN